MYQDIYNCICQNTKQMRFIIHYVKQPNCCLEYDFQKVDQHAGGKWLIRSYIQYMILMSLTNRFATTACDRSMSKVHYVYDIVYFSKNFNQTLPGQNGRLFTDDISDAFSWMKSFYFEISLKCVPTRPIDSKPALVLIMAWCGMGNKPLSEPMLTLFTDTYMWQ